MKRLGVVLLAALLVAAGVLSATVLAGTGLPSLGSTSASTETATTDTSAMTTVATTTVATTATTATTPTATTPKPKPKPKPRDVRVPAGVTVGGVHVGGLSPKAAYQAVRAVFSSPLQLVLGKQRVQVSPAALGAVAYVKPAVARAMHARPGAAVKVTVVVHSEATRAYVTSLGDRFDAKAVDAQVFLRNLRPLVTKSSIGRQLDRKGALKMIVAALIANRRVPLRLPVKTLKPKLASDDFGPVIVIHRGSNRLYYYQGSKLARVFGVATGQSVYPTPLGHFQIVVKWENPWWYPPASPWAQGLKPIPPGPGNPLGTRWMGLSAPGVGIHGTPDAASIGYSASHGCIRMYIPDAEWLFNHVEIGTPVFIVSE